VIPPITPLDRDRTALAAIVLTTRSVTSAGLLLVTCVCAALFAQQGTTATPAVKEATNTGLSVTVIPDHIQWGEETEIRVTASNREGVTLSGGLYVSFDDDILVLEVKGGKVLRSNDMIFDLNTSTSHAVMRPVVESWEESWKAGVERSLVLVVLPLARERVRVLARATFLGSGPQPQLFISPGTFESRSLDEASFPTRVGYVWITQNESLRRALRRFERRMRDLDTVEQRRFALALATALEDPKALNDLLKDTSTPDLKLFKQSLLAAAPGIAIQLRSDPLIALDNLRCLMANLDCRSALVYFGMPLSVYRELSAEEIARNEAKTQITSEKGGNELIGLLEAEGISYRREKMGAITVQLNGVSVEIEPGRPVVKGLLDRLITALGPAAEKPYPEVGGMSFARLRSQLGGAP
jgi:hypothetical protein